MGFAELDLAGHELGSPQDDKQRLVIDLELRPLMGAVGVFDRQFMEVEAVLHLSQHFLVGFMQPDPDKGALTRGVFVELIDIQIGDPAAILIGRASHDLAHSELPAPYPDGSSTLAPNSLTSPPVPLPTFEP